MILTKKDIEQKIQANNDLVAELRKVSAAVSSAQASSSAKVWTCAVIDSRVSALVDLNRKLVGGLYQMENDDVGKLFIGGVRV